MQEELIRKIVSIVQSNSWFDENEDKILFV
jgi:hypothetical protein